MTEKPVEPRKSPSLGQPRRGRAPRPTGMAWFIVAMGLVPLSFGAWALKLGLETFGWPRVEAVIVDETLSLRDDTPSRSSSSIGAFGLRQRTEFASFAVRFRYEFDGRARIGTGVERGDLGLQNSAKSRELSDAHPVGSKATVVVDPTDPDDAYLLVGPSSAAKMLTGVGVALISIGLWMRSLMRRGLGSARRADEA